MKGVPAAFATLDVGAAISGVAVDPVHNVWLISIRETGQVHYGAYDPATGVMTKNGAVNTISVASGGITAMLPSSCTWLNGDNAFGAAAGKIHYGSYDPVTGLPSAGGAINTIFSGSDGGGVRADVVNDVWHYSSDNYGRQIVYGNMSGGIPVARGSFSWPGTASGTHVSAYDPSLARCWGGWTAFTATYDITTGQPSGAVDVDSGDPTLHYGLHGADPERRYLWGQNNGVVYTYDDAGLIAPLHDIDYRINSPGGYLACVEVYAQLLLLIDGTNVHVGKYC